MAGPEAAPLKTGHRAATLARTRPLIEPAVLVTVAGLALPVGLLLCNFPPPRVKDGRMIAG